MSYKTPTTNTSLDDIAKDGSFQRKPTIFRSRISHGTEFAPAKVSTDLMISKLISSQNRYHIYVSLACPWANRVLITRNLLGLEDAIDVSIVQPIFGPNGWTFDPTIGHLEGFEFPASTPDRVNGFTHLKELYEAAKPGYCGRYTVPVLYDKITKQIVNNESIEIISILNHDMREFAKNQDLDLVPTSRKGDIDATYDWIYNCINNGVYKCGFARSQASYDCAFTALFNGLDKCEEILGNQPYICGNSLTSVDICLFTTLIRFDCVYYGHFKTNKKSIQFGFPNLWAYIKRLYSNPAFSSTIDMQQITCHYYGSHRTINPAGIVPRGWTDVLAAFAL